jgi:hypothetical protein
VGEWCSKFRCCSLDAKYFAFFWKFEIPDEVIVLAFCDLMIVLGTLSEILKADGCCSSLFEEKLYSLSKYIAKLCGGSGTESPLP